MICSQGALAKGTSSFPPYKKERPQKKRKKGGGEEKGGEFFLRERERGLEN